MPFIATGGNFGSNPSLDLTPGTDFLVSILLSNAQHLFTVTPRSGGSPFTRVLARFGVTVFRGDDIARIVIDSTDANALWECGKPGSFDTAIQNGGGVSVISGNVPVVGQHFANGGASPIDGLASVLVKATSTDPITLTDGTLTFQLTASATGQWQFFQFPVLATVTYTLAGIGLAILGGNIVVE